MTEQRPQAFSNLIRNSNDDSLQQNDTETNLLRQKIDEWLRLTFHKEQFAELVECIHSNDRFKQHFGTIGIRNLLSSSEPPIQAVIDANLVPRLIEFVQNDNEHHLQLESIWALTNVAFGTTQQTQVIIDKGGIPSFIKRLRSHLPEIAEQAIWAIGNISGDSSTFRDIVLEQGGLEPLLEIADSIKDSKLIKNCTWAISNLCRGKPLPKFERVKSAIPILCKIIQQEKDIETLTDATWALSYLSGSRPGFEYELSIEILPVLLAYLDHTHLALVVPCIVTLKNITQDHSVQNAALAEPSYLPKLMKLTCHSRKALRRESCKSISNITAGDSGHIEALIKHHHYVDMIINLATRDIPEIKRKAVYILSNTAKHGNLKQLSVLAELGVLECLLENLSSTDKETVEAAANGLNCFLRAESIAYQQKEKTEHEFLNLFLAKRGLQKLIRLGHHPKTEIRSLAGRIVQDHFESHLKDSILIDKITQV